MGRGPRPDDRALFAPAAVDRLRAAVADLAWLATRGYVGPAARKLVGDRHGLRARQRDAVARACCSDRARAQRLARRTDDLTGRTVVVDGFNCVITVEAALAGGVLLRGRDGVLRDMASVHGSYRRVATTARALDLLAATLQAARPRAVRWLLDAPVSNSGRLAAWLRERAVAGLPWTVETVPDPDPLLCALPPGAVAATSDGDVLDRCGPWTDLAGATIRAHVPHAWCIDLAVRPDPRAPP